MASKSTKTSKQKKVVETELEPVIKDEVVKKVEKNDNDLFDAELDPAEEKMLDRILSVIVAFILGWLGLSILLVLRGYLCTDVVQGAFFCAGL